MSAPTKNERKVCEAVARMLEERAGAKREKPRRPEVDKKGPPVDYRFDLAGTNYAIEHTEIEPFSQQIEFAQRFDSFVTPIEAGLDHQMPKPGVYYLTFPIDPCAELRSTDLPS